MPSFSPHPAPLSYRFALAVGLVACAACGGPPPAMNVAGRPVTARIPPAEESDEANRYLLSLAREQGAALRKALDAMLYQQAASGGGEKRVGDYVVAYAVEYAEGYYEHESDRMEYTPTGTSTEHNAHVEICVLDGYDGRFVPELSVWVTLFDADGRELGTKREPFMWHPWLYHYGENWRVPHDGFYTLRVRIDAPSFRRHDVQNGQRYAAPAYVDFEHVYIKTGGK